MALECNLDLFGYGLTSESTIFQSCQDFLAVLIYTMGSLKCFF